jgi:hypothetical protein
MDTAGAWLVLRSPELLSLIFCCTDKGTNATCAIVCKAWLNPSLNELWRFIDDPLILLKLLAPMHKTDDLCGNSRVRGLIDCKTSHTLTGQALVVIFALCPANGLAAF